VARVGICYGVGGGVVASAGPGLGRHSHSLALLGLTPGVGAYWFGAAPVRLLSPIVCSLHIYLAVYYLCRLQCPCLRRVLLRQRTSMPVYSLSLPLYETLEVGDARDEGL
jgi:hypothetical protein